MFQTHVSCNLWDLVEEGPAAVLDRIVGEAGAGGVSLSLMHPVTSVLRPRQAALPRTFRSQGGLQFQPSREFYAATRVRPLTAEWLRKTNPLTGVAQACADRGLLLRGRITCCRSELHASRYDFCAAKDVFGDVHPGWLCPSNPDVREFLRALVTDAAGSYPLDSLQLDDAWYPPPAAWRTSRAVCMELGQGGEWLLSLCFCESCRQGAGGEGLDVAAAARSVMVTLDRSLETGEPVRQSVSELLETDPVLRAYAHWRSAQVTRLVSILREACPCRLALAHAGDAAGTGTDARSVALRADALVVGPAGAVDEVEPAVQAVAADVPDLSRIELAVSACAPTCPDSAALVRSLSTAVRLGIRTATVFEYGLIPPARMGWIKQATRYAQRESE